ncbi:uncharacterized protein RAG0_00435 [Rhynchosporium agropyri]|uniref:Uncharacterized protein n=1 Tax=Rhynchosporium agropyri TaxID=914238 RepID=A0A1E1JSM3_9HELO|nr:uncharacterized protein RAG0_00435 [Rhynchosporium agropyri]
MPFDNFDEQWNDFVKEGNEGNKIAKTFPFNSERPNHIARESSNWDYKKDARYHSGPKKDLNPRAASFEPTSSRKESHK